MALHDTQEKIKSILKQHIPQHQHDIVNNLTLDLIQTEDRIKIMIIRIDPNFIGNVLYISDAFKADIKKVYPDYFVYFMRSLSATKTGNANGINEIVNMKKHEMRALHEKWINDLAYPELVKGRMTVYTNSGKMEQVIVERSPNRDENELRNMEYAFMKMTDRPVRFTFSEK